MTSFLLTSARKDLRRRLADPLALVLWLGIPLVIGGLLTMFGAGTGNSPIARLLIVNQDDSLLAGLLEAAARQGTLGGVLQVEAVELPDGRRRIDAGEATALLVIPPGFGTAVVNEEPTELTLITNPAQRILPAIVQEGLEILVEALFYGQRLFAPELRTITAFDATDNGPSLGQVNALSTAIYDRIQEVQPLLLPPVLRLGTEEQSGERDADNEPAVNIARLFLPAMLFMTILFVAQGMSDDLWHESRDGTLRRMLASPRRVELLLGGKLLAGMAIAGAVGAIALAVARWQFEVLMWQLPLAWLWCTFAGGVLLVYFFTIQSLAGNQRAGSVLSTVVLFPIMMLGGSFFPFAAMPSWMAAIGRWTPNGLALTRFEQILWGTARPAAVATAAAAIGIPAAIAFILCAHRLRTGPMARS